MNYEAAKRLLSCHQSSTHEHKPEADESARGGRNWFSDSRRDASSGARGSDEIIGCLAVLDSKSHRARHSYLAIKCLFCSTDALFWCVITAVAGLKGTNLGEIIAKKA
jgi:hypothetical protein